MHALIISNSSTVIMNVINFLISIGYKMRKIYTIMSLAENISHHWARIIYSSKGKIFIYFDPSINDLSFSQEPFTPLALRKLIYASPASNEIYLIISSSEIFEMYWMCKKSSLLSSKEDYSLYKSNKYPKSKVKISIISGNVNMSQILPSLHFCNFCDMPKLYDVCVSFGNDKTVSELFI